jgi:hypothetical protein
LRRSSCRFGSEVQSVAAQSGDSAIEGSPTSLDEPAGNLTLPVEPTIASDPDDVPEPANSLVSQMKPYWRPPYGDINASVLSDVYSGIYYVSVVWSCDTLAWNGASEQQILNRCMYPMGAGDIILMHVGSDGLDWAATDNMIRYFQGQGLQLVTVEDLLSS